MIDARVDTFPLKADLIYNSEMEYNVPAIKHESRDLERFFKLSEDPFCIAGFNGYFKVVNPAFSRLLGYSEEELLLQPFTTFVFEDDLNKTINALDSIIENGNLNSIEIRYRCKDESIKYLAWRFFVVREENVIYAIARDITEEKNAEARLIKQTEALKELIAYKDEGLRYAGFLQEALFQDPDTLRTIFAQSFIFHSPKDLIGGDLYWFEKLGKRVFLACGDCTGHGVPGAMLTVLGLSKLNSTITSPALRPGEILDTLNHVMYTALGKKHSSKRVNDSIDIALLSVDTDSLLLNYSGANRPLYIVRQGGLIELAGNKTSIGENGTASVFTNKSFQLKKDDMLYLFSDGYTDQFGGEKGKKFTTKRFKELITSLAGNSAEKQKEQLRNTLTNWMNGEMQTDDICVIGVRI